MFFLLIFFFVQSGGKSPNLSLDEIEDLDIRFFFNFTQMKIQVVIQVATHVVEKIESR